jgi:hypothetical protein
VIAGFVPCVPAVLSPRFRNDNLFHGDKYKWSAQLTAINITNKLALYNFLSTFSGTHYVSPRVVTAQLTFNF